MDPLSFLAGVVTGWVVLPPLIVWFVRRQLT